MTKGINKAGFSIIEALVVVVVVAVVGATGWLAYKDHHHKVSTISATTSNAPQTKATKPTADNTPTTQPVTQYLDITQWGVKLPLSSAISDAYYVVSKTSSYDADGLPSTVWLGLTSLTSASCNPANNNHGGSGAIGAILRTPPTETDAVTGVPLTEKYPNGVTIGNYYYAYQSWFNDPNNTCPKTSMQSADSAFAIATKNIAPDSSSSTTSN